MRISRRSALWQSISSWPTELAPRVASFDCVDLDPADKPAGEMPEVRLKAGCCGWTGSLRSRNRSDFGYRADFDGRDGLPF